jgi:hypothetical protein
MRVNSEELVLSAKVGPGRIDRKLMYVFDERGIELNLEVTRYGLKWTPEDELEITIRRIRKGNANEKMESVVPESQGRVPDVGVPDAT